MFGYLVANLEDASDQEKARYRAAYCGLCRTLGGRCGQRCRLALTYDMAFLVLLHGSLYEPEETQDQARCLLHPLSPHDFVQTRFTGYAADLTVALAYHKCWDDWHDDRNVAARTGAAALAKPYRQVRERLPRQCAAIEDEACRHRPAGAGERARARRGRPLLRPADGRSCSSSSRIPGRKRSGAWDGIWAGSST